MSGTMQAMVIVRLVRSACAARLGAYPSSRAALVMRSHVSAGMAGAPPLSTIETVAWETPASRATSFWVALALTDFASLIRNSDTYKRCLICQGTARSAEVSSLNLSVNYVNQGLR